HVRLCAWLVAVGGSAGPGPTDHSRLSRRFGRRSISEGYSLMAESQRTLESFDRFSKRIREFNTEAGAAKERRILKITWTKDPANAPAPGVYAAVDLASRFENIDRHCGYIVLYQRDAGL